MPVHGALDLKPDLVLKILQILFNGPLLLLTLGVLVLEAIGVVQGAWRIS